MIRPDHQLRALLQDSRSGRSRPTRSHFALTRLACFIIVAVSYSFGAHAAPSAPSPAADRFVQAITIYNKAASLRAAGDAFAPAHFRHAALLLDSLADPPNSHSQDSAIPDSYRSHDPRVLRAAALAFHHAGEPGFAHLYARRALFARPFDRDLLALLPASPSRESATPPDSARPHLEQAASYLELIPLSIRQWTLLASWCAAWLLLTSRHVAPRTLVPRWLPMTLISVTAVAAATLAPREFLFRFDRTAVIVSSAALRTEPIASSPSARAEPLPAGSVVRFVNAANDWTCISLPNSTDLLWIHSEHVRRLFPRPHAATTGSR